MRVARVLLLVCLIVGLAAIHAGARGHLRELSRSYLEGEERALLAELKQRAGVAAAELERRLESGPVVATYSPAGELLSPAPPAIARSWRPPALSHAALAMARSDYARALEVARTSADRAAVYLARGQQTGDPSMLRRAMAEPEFAGTDMYYRTALEVFRLDGVEPDDEWRDRVSALQDGLREWLLAEAGCEPLPPDRATRRRLAQLRPREGSFLAGEMLYRGSPRAGSIELRGVSLAAFEGGEGPLHVALPEPFSTLRLHGAVDRAAVERAVVPVRRRLIAYYGLAAAILLAGTVYAYLAIGRAFRLAQAKSEFVANVSHELKTPLANIRLFAESLAAGRVRADDRPEFLKTILDESGRLEVLVDGLLHAARGTRVEKQRVDAQALLLEAEERWRPRLEREGFEFTVEAPALPALQADRESLLRAIGNLIDNARKYSVPDKRIALVGEAANGSVRFTVTDKGPGIPVRERDHVLSPFTRIESADRKETAGTGLGLSLVVACVEAHGGTITIADAPGRGAAITLVVPAEDAEEEG